LESRLLTLLATSYHSGINPVSQIWNNTLVNDFTAAGIALAERSVSANVEALGDSIRTIHTDKELSSSADPSLLRRRAY
jgi:hypothetical protein